MRAIYLETSFLGRALIHQQRAELQVLRQHARRSAIFTSELTALELERALRQVESRSDLPGGEINQLRRQIAGWIARFHIRSLSSEILERAAREFLVEPIRTLDALHLATALEVRDEFGGISGVLTRDRRIEENATAYGISLL